MKRGGWHFLRPYGGHTLHAFKVPDGGRVEPWDRCACRDFQYQELPSFRASDNQLPINEDCFSDGPAHEWPGCDHQQVMLWYAGNLDEPPKPTPAAPRTPQRVDRSVPPKRPSGRGRFIAPSDRSTTSNLDADRLRRDRESREYRQRRRQERERGRRLRSRIRTRDDGDA